MAVQFQNEPGQIEFTPAAAPGRRAKIRLDHTIFADDFRFLQSVTSPGRRPS